MMMKLLIVFICKNKFFILQFKSIIGKKYLNKIWNDIFLIIILHNIILFWKKKLKK